VNAESPPDDLDHPSTKKSSSCWVFVGVLKGGPEVSGQELKQHKFEKRCSRCARAVRQQGRRSMTEPHLPTPTTRPPTTTTQAMVRSVSVLLLLLVLTLLAPSVMSFFHGSRPFLRLLFAARSSHHTRRPVCMSMTKLQDELTVAIQAARKAGIAAKGLQKTLLEAKSAAIKKSDSSPVTIADYSVQALVVGGLRAAFPTDQVVAEETSVVLRQDRAALAAVTEVVRRESANPALTEEDLCGVLDHGTTPGPR